METKRQSYGLIALRRPQSIRLELVLVVLFLAAGGASAGSGADDSADQARETLAFRRQPLDRPVIDSGTPGRPVLVMDPMVLADSEGYHLFYSTFFCKSDGSLAHAFDSLAGKTDTAAPLVSALGYAFSADKGTTWRFRPTPVLVPAENAWEKHKVETAFVVRDNDQLLLFYSALGYHDGRLLDNRFQLGVSRLPLAGRGIREALLSTETMFQRIRTTPLVPFDLTKTCFMNNVQEPSVVCRDGRFEVYFLGIGFALPDQTPEANGQKFVEIGLGRAVFDTQFRELERTDKPILHGVNMPEVTFVDGRYWLFSTGFGSGLVHKGSYLQCSTSVDGVHWERPRAILEARKEGTFDNWGIAAPTLVRDNAQWVLFYSALGVTPARPGESFGQAGPFTLTAKKWAIRLPQENRAVGANLGRAVSEVPRAGTSK
jgi:predicted GH43/DUF377 family glycosyl hydrolase